MSLAPGTRLGVYEITAPIGAGGMGEVYRAKDARLGRDVAIKVLPESLANDAVRRERFEREAKAVAALSHPNIIGIHDTGLHDGHPFVVMELLEGETLRDRLTAGALPVRKAVEIAVQIARALGAAHDKQIVHRDLKPENIFVLRDGHVKILDFGLARDFATHSGATETRAAITDAGIAMGTVGYMAPEQIRAQAVDGRTDLFAFGAVLFEMLSGVRAFQRETAAETMTAILREDVPDLIGTNAQMPPSLDRIVRHCLEKNPAERFQSARDVAFALEALSGSGVASSAAIAVVAERRGGRSRAVALAGASAVALVALTVVAVRWLWPIPAAREWTGVQLGGPEIAMCPRISPDGSMLAFVAMDGNMTQVAVMKPESGTATILTHKRNAGYVDELSWAPDGSKIYFDRTSDVPMGVFSVAVFGGGDEQLVAEDAMSPDALGDGSLLVTRLNAELKPRLNHFWPDTGRWQELPIEPSGTGYSSRAHVFSDGREAVVAGTLVSDGPSSGTHLYVVDVASGRTRRLTTGLADESSISSGIAVTRDGRSVLAVGRAGSFYRIVEIPRNGAAPHTLLSFTTRVNYLDVGPDGRIYSDQTDGPLSLWRFSARGGHAEKVATLHSAHATSAVIAVLPDGRTVSTESIGDHSRLMVFEAGKDPRPLAVTQEDTSGPVAVVGSDSAAFLVGSAAPQTIAFTTIATGRIGNEIRFDKGPIDSLAASADGKTLYVAAGGTIWAQPISGGEPHKVRAGNSAAVDPSGRHLLVQVIETPRSRLFDVPLPGGPEREIPLNGPYHLTFDRLNSGAISPDGRLLVPLASPDNWFFPPGVVDLATGRMTELVVDHFGDYHVLLWTRDGQIVAGAYDLRSSLWRFQPEVR